MSRSDTMKMTCVAGFAAAVAACVVACGARSKDATAAAAPEIRRGESGEPEATALSSQQVSLAGIETRPLVSSPLADVVTGQATVLTHDVIAQSLADVRIAEATAVQSAAAFKRMESLQGSPGALGEDSVAVARRQATVDSLQRQLARRRFQALFGDGARRLGDAEWNTLAEGSRKLLRVVFSDSTIAPSQASRLRFRELSGSLTRWPWSAAAVWVAPADGGAPGRSLLAVVDNRELPEGSRLLAGSTLSAKGTGVLVPEAAVVMHEGKLWCFVRAGDGEYLRRAVSAEHATDTGYVQAYAFRAGEQVVVRGAGLLLAREFGSAEE